MIQSLFFSLLSCFAIAWFAFSNSAQAAPIGLDAFSESDRLIDFDALAGGGSLSTGEVVTDQFAEDGVVFNNSYGASRANASISGLATLNSDPNVVWNDQGGGNAGANQFVEIVFSVPIQKIGLLFITSPSADFTLEIYGAGDVLLEGLTLMGDASGSQVLEGFAGLSADRSIARATLSSRSSFGTSFNFSIDDLRFSPVPEPGTALLLGLGLTGLGMGRRSERKGLKSR